MRIINTCGLIILMTMVVVSCSGGSGPAQMNDPQPATLTGAVEISGAPLADLDNPEIVGEQDAAKWSLKLIDPVEDVDNIELPVEPTTFSAAGITLTGEYLLSVDILPAVDLSGGTAVTTPVTLNIPVTVAAGETTQVFASIELLEAAATISHTTAQAGGARVRLKYTVATPTLNETGFLELDWNGNRVRRDSNGDHSFEDEEYFADTNRDGLSNELRAQLIDRIRLPQRFTFEGVLTGLEPQQHLILIDGDPYRVTESTIFWRHTQRVHLGDLEPGQQLRIRGHAGLGTAKYAEEVRILNVRK